MEGGGSGNANVFKFGGGGVLRILNLGEGGFAVWYFDFGSDIILIGRGGEKMNILLWPPGLVILSTIGLWHFYNMCFCTSNLYYDDICNCKCISVYFEMKSTSLLCFYAFLEQKSLRQRTFSARMHQNICVWAIDSYHHQH